MQNIIFTKYSNDRDPKFNIVTEIVSNDLGEKWVVKRPFTEEAQAHVSCIVENCSILKEQYRGTNVDIAEAVKDGEAVRIPWVEGEAFSEYLDRLLMQGEREEWTKQVKAYFDCVLAHKKKRFVKTAEFEAMFGNVSIGEEEEAISNVDVDILFSNVLYKDGKWTLYDCEWAVRFDVPVKFLIYRCLIYYIIPQSNLAMQQKHIYEEFGISEKECKTYQEIEEGFQKYIVGDFKPIWQLYYKIHGEVVSAQALHERYIHDSKVQIFYDYGEGFSEKLSKVVMAEKLDRGHCRVCVQIPEKVVSVRFDPAGGACMVYDMVVRNADGKMVQYVTNGHLIEPGTYLFLHSDPQIVIREEAVGGGILFEYGLNLLNNIDGFAIEHMNIFLTETLQKKEELLSEKKRVEEEFKRQMREKEAEIEDIKKAYYQKDMVLDQILHSKRWKIINLIH